MAFQNWVDDDKLSNILSAYYFTNDQQRQEGFKAGQVASAIRVNSGLRQANLVACALMDSISVGTNPNVNLQTSRTQLASVISEALNSRLKYVSLYGTDAVEGNIVPKTHNTINLGANDKRWSNVYTNDVQYSGGSLTGLKQSVTDNKQEADDAISALNSKMNIVLPLSYTSKRSFSDANIGNIHVNQAEYYKVGSVVSYSFQGSCTGSIASGWVVGDLSSDSLAEYRPNMGNNYPVGWLVNTTNQVIYPIVWDNDAKKLKLVASYAFESTSIYGYCIYNTF